MAIYFSDDFNRGDSATLGGNWVDNGGDFQVKSNQMYASGVSSSYNTTAVGSADYDLEYTMIYDARSGQPGYGWWSEPYVRSSGATRFNDCYFAYIQNYFDNTTGTSIYKRVGGSQTLLSAEVKAASVNTTIYTYKLSVSGSTIKLYKNGVEKNSATDTSHTLEGNHGMRCDSGVYVDDYVIYGPDTTAIRDFIGGGYIPYLR